MQLQHDYFAAYRSLRLTRDAEGVLVGEFHSNGGPFAFTAQDHTELVDAFYRIAQDRANKIVILTGAGGDFIPSIDFSSFGNVADPAVWSQVHDEGVQIVENLANVRVPMIAADPDLLHRAISNLVLNAMDAMPQAGTLTLRTRQDGERVRLEVSDTGSGLTPEESERLFTPYYTSKEHGTGLGLAIVQSVVSDHGGKISLESAPGRGSTFRIELPLNMDRLSAEQNHASAAKPGSFI